VAAGSDLLNRRGAEALTEAEQKAALRFLRDLDKAYESVDVLFREVQKRYLTYKKEISRAAGHS
jgi:hypothetical protein